MKERIVAAIVGCGRMGRERAARLLRLNVRIAFLVDDVEERAETLARDVPGALVARSIDDVDVGTVDAVFVCTPPGSRRASVSAAAIAGRALFLEKPLATNMEEATWTRDLVASAGLVTSVGYMNRYRAGILRARTLANSTSVLGIGCHWAGGRYRVPWWGDAALSGGPLNEQATHLVDLCRYLGGEIDDVEARMTPHGETAAALFRFRSGALGTLLYTCGAPQKAIGLQIFTDQGALQLDGWDFRLTRDPREPAPVADTEDPFAAETAAFVDAVESEDGSKVLCDVADAFETQCVMERLRSAAKLAGDAMAAGV